MEEDVKKYPKQEDLPLDCPPSWRFESYTIEEIDEMYENVMEDWRNGIVPDNVYGRPLDQLY